MLKKYNTIIFDFDGTLIYTLEDIKDSVNYALRKFNLREKSLNEIRSLVGDGAYRLIELCVHDGKNNIHFDEIFNVYKNHYSENYKNKTKPYPEIISLLNKLSEKGYKLGIVSNKYDNLVKYLNKLYFEDLIPVAIGESDIIRKKPAPDGVLEALRQLNSQKDQSIYIGDSEVDIQTAKNVGLDFISVSYGYRDIELLKENGAIKIADKPLDLLKWL
ncbi:MAG: HAD-superfamily hydrolase, subfamily variant 1 [Bacillota bacterium]|nr:HAD-superfamily hydrolase, subfamily variant 1 [Bacillota bacterium]